MSTIYSLPLTNVLVNGSKTYRLKTKDYDAVLQHVEVESKTNETINLNFEDLYFESIAFKGGSDLGETTLQAIRNTMDVKNYYTVDSRPITCSDDLKELFLPELQFLVSRGYVIDIPVPVFKDIKLDLNNAWRRCQTYTSPLEGWTLYESASNWHVGGESSICYLNIVSNDAPLVIYYCSYAEAQFDWLNIGFPDGTGVDTLRSWQEPPTSIDTMGLVEKSADMTGMCTITYQKDGSVDSGDDRAYILLPNDIQYSNEYVEPVPEPIYIQSMNIFGAETIKTEGTVEYFASIFPVDADTYNLGWYIDEAPTGVVARIRWTSDNPKYAYLEVDSIDEGVDSEITIVCYDDVSGVEQSYSIRIYKEAAPIHIQNITISGPSQITEPGTYDYYASYSPDNADEYDIDWSFVAGFTEEHITLQTDPNNPFHAQLIVSQPDTSFSAAFAIECEDNISYNYDRFNVAVDVHVEPPVVSDNIYYSNDLHDARKNYVLNKSTSTWSTKTWSGLNHIYGSNIWTDGEKIYYNGDWRQYVLDKSSGSWVEKEWSGKTNFLGQSVWTDGEDIYYSRASEHYVLDKETSTWTNKTWSGLTSFYGEYVWTDGENIYYSSGSEQYVLNKETSTWTKKTWRGLTGFGGEYVWTDGEKIYYSNGSSQYVLNKATSTWTITVIWSGLTSFYGISIWADGDNIYYSDVSTQYVLDKATSHWNQKTWSGLTSFSGYDIWSDNPQFKTSCSCHCSTFAAFNQ